MHSLLYDFCSSDQRFARGLVGSPHPASFRFAVTCNTLAFGYILPATGRIRDLHPLETCAARRTLKKYGAESQICKIGFGAVFSTFLSYCPSANGQSVTYTDDEIFDSMNGTGNFVSARGFLTELLGNSVLGTSEFYNACRESYSGAVPVFTATVTVEGEYSTLSETYSFYIDPSLVTVNVTGVSLDKGSIVF